jgi:hypothetical protein
MEFIEKFSLFVKIYNAFLIIVGFNNLKITIKRYKYNGKVFIKIISPRTK